MYVVSNYKSLEEAFKPILDQLLEIGFGMMIVSICILKIEDLGMKFTEPLFRLDLILVDMFPSCTDEG